MGESQFQAGLVTLLKEAFTGIAPGQDGTWIVQGKEGIFDAVASVTAEQASVKPNPSCPSIAAHAFHILFSLRNGNSNIGRPSPEGAWKQVGTRRLSAIKNGQTLQNKFGMSMTFAWILYRKTTIGAMLMLPPALSVNWHICPITSVQFER